MKKVIISDFKSRRNDECLFVIVMDDGDTHSIDFYRRTGKGYTEFRDEFRKLDPLPSRDNIEFREIDGQMKDYILELLYGKSGG